MSADSVIGLQTETPISSEHARVEDRVEARVTRDVKVGDVADDGEVEFDAAPVGHV